ncbi:hypothetical protein H5410_014908 [Solanum commersonii]|uniref:Uncharacterized protein n=1 Tax=Solanum commersonii TaxID=4109 RepID=A0A9J5ZST9_SOLCO|nr:hypothetical protein H5410_014908 [Solanum commersonii]
MGSPPCACPTVSARSVPRGDEAYIRIPGRVDQPITMPDRHSRVPAQLENQTWKRLSSGGLECPLVNLYQQHVGKVNRHSFYQCCNHDRYVPCELIVSFCRRHPITHQHPEELGHKIQCGLLDT